MNEEPIHYEPEQGVVRQCFTCNTITRHAIICSACGEPVCDDCIVKGRHSHLFGDWNDSQA